MILQFLTKISIITLFLLLKKSRVWKSIEQLLVYKQEMLKINDILDRHCSEISCISSLCPVLSSHKLMLNPIH